MSDLTPAQKELLQVVEAIIQNQTFIQFAVKRPLGGMSPPPLGATCSDLMDKLSVTYKAVIEEMSVA